MGRANLLRCSR